MENNETLFSQIEDYISGNLDGKELKAFSEKLQSDPELQKKVAFHKEIMEAMSNIKGDKEFQSKLKSIGENYRNSSDAGGNANLFSFKRMAIAASILLLVSLGVWMYSLSQKSLSGAEIFAREFTVPELLARERAGDNGLDPVLRDAFAEYEKGRYSSALSYFDEALQNAERPAIWYYRGITQMAVDPPSPDSALDSFSKVIKNGDNSFIYAAKWNSALALLKMEDLTGAKVLLRELSASNNKYQEKAVDLLALLD